MCCTSSRGCDNATNITTSGIALNSTIIDQTVIRCDGYRSCTNVANSIFAQNGGNIYLAAGWAAYNDVFDSFIKTTDEYIVLFVVEVEVEVAMAVQ